MKKKLNLMKTTKERNNEIYNTWLKIGSLKNGFPHGCFEWKEFKKNKKEIRKILWSIFNA